MKEKKKLKDWIAEHQRTLTIIADGCITVGVFGLGVALGKVVQSSYDCNCMGWAQLCRIQAPHSLPDQRT